MTRRKNGMDELHALVLAKRAELAEVVEAQLRRVFSAAVSKLGPTLPRVYNDPDFGRMWSNTMKHLVDGGGGRTAASIDEEKLRSYAHDYARNSLEELFQKLIAKVGDLEGATAQGLSGFDFQLAGHRDAHRVVVDQQMIVNVSSRGTLFNQFPARIRVDGKAVSEAAYKSMFGEATPAEIKRALQGQRQAERETAKAAKAAERRAREAAADAREDKRQAAEFEKNVKKFAKYADFYDYVQQENDREAGGMSRMWECSPDDPQVLAQLAHPQRQSRLRILWRSFRDEPP